MLLGATARAQGAPTTQSPVDEPSTSQQGPEQTYDPDQNMADDGTTVIKPDLPDDLKNPDRWRYTPGGRIKPGNIFERAFVTTFPTPIFFRSEDVGFGGGIALTDIDFRNQRFREFANIVASYTEEGQQAYRFAWRRWLHHREIPEGGIIRDERSAWGINAGYVRTLTRRFFGLEGQSDGPRGESDARDETSYTEDFIVLGTFVDVSYPDPGDDLRIGAGVRFEAHHLQQGEVVGIPSTGDPENVTPGLGGFQNLFERGEDIQQLWLNSGIAYDTRDSVSNPYEGFRVGLSIDSAVAQSGLPPAAILTSDVTAAFTVPPLFHDGGRPEEQNPPTDVVALSMFVSQTVGDLPFYSLPSLGGDRTLRGFIQNRFTGNTAAHGSFEYRFAIVPRGIRFTKTIRLERVSVAGFYDFGWIADDLGDLGSNYVDSYGFGVRLGLAREAVFRIDVGFSAEDTNLTVSFGNPF